ncbi:GNAT family N-acetyltransferase [Glaciecola sp. 1036]|uniref:GNAT family N-acetyltransferase n=1 Tax=Alteromonadaceae TaxID=72275 RepID=UPI003D0012C7
MIEQNCLYLDADGKDPKCKHLFYYAGDTLAAYARLLPKGTSYPSVSIGRILVAEEFRKHALGKQLVEDAIKSCHSFWPDETITIGAQKYLLNFYQSLGFKVIGDEYLEDGIMHVDMQLQ